MKIKRIVSVTDTRDYEEIGDRWVPIPGTGQANECARCGRLHEVHATVELADGSAAVVGTGCMKAESAEIVKAAKRGAARAKRIASLQAEIDALEALADRNREIEAAVMALEAPAVTCRESGPGDYAEWTYTAGDVSTYSYRREAEAEATALRQWRQKRASEMGRTFKMESAGRYLSAAREAIAKASR